MTHEQGKTFGQIVGLVGVLSAVIHALPADLRTKIRQEIENEFEPTIARLLAETHPNADAEREGAEMVRDSFIESLDSRTD